MAITLTTELALSQAPLSTVVVNPATGFRYCKSTPTAWYPMDLAFPAGIRHRDMILMAWPHGFIGFAPKSAG
jgi:hypothetical protein